MQRAHGVRVHFREDGEDFGDPGLPFGCGFGPFPVSWYLDVRARLLLLAGALAAFGGSLFAGFHLDDYAIFPASGLRPFGWPHPFTHLLDWLNWQVAGQQPAGYHAVNLLLHCGAVLLAYECLRRLVPARAAMVAATIFAAHPLQAETVDYVGARGAMVVALLGLAGLLAWLRGWRWVALPIGLAAMVEVAVPALRWAHAIRSWRLFVLPWGFTIADPVREPLWAIMTVTVAVIAWRWRKPEARWLLIGLALSPLSGYLAVFAFAAAVGVALVTKIESPAWVGAALVVLLVALSVSRTYVWMSEERLWREAMQRAPELAQPKIQLAKSVRAAEALELLSRARQQAPYDATIPAEIGKVLLDEQQYQGALDELSRAVAMDPRNALAFNNRGVALAALGQSAAAAADFQHAVTLDASLAEARENLKRLTGK